MELIYHKKQLSLKGKVKKVKQLKFYCTEKYGQIIKEASIYGAKSQKFNWLYFSCESGTKRTVKSGSAISSSNGYMGRSILL